MQMIFICVTAFNAPFEIQLQKPPAASLFKTVSKYLCSSSREKQREMFIFFSKIPENISMGGLQLPASVLLHCCVLTSWWLQGFSDCLPSTKGRPRLCTWRGKTPAVWKKRLTAGTHDLAAITHHFIMPRLQWAPELQSDAGVGAAGRLLEAELLIVELPRVVLCRRCFVHDNQHESVYRLKQDNSSTVLSIFVFFVYV